MSKRRVYSPEYKREAVALADRVGLNDVKWQQILKTREHHEVDTIVTLISHHNS